MLQNTQEVSGTVQNKNIKSHTRLLTDLDDTKELHSLEGLKGI